MWKIGRCLLRDRLREAKMTQTELAFRLNIGRGRVNDYVHGRHIMSLEVALNISKVLGCSVTLLYEWDRE